MATTLYGEELACAYFSMEREVERLAAELRHQAGNPLEVARQFVLAERVAKQLGDAMVKEREEEERRANRG